MNVEGDYRYVDPGAFDECTDFLAYLENYEYDWESAFVRWTGEYKRAKESRKRSQNAWDTWNLVKVPDFHSIPWEMLNLSLPLFLFMRRMFISMPY